MSKSLQGKIIVITGASSGLGAELAQQVAKFGAIPILLARSISKLSEVAKSIENEHDMYEMDVTSDEQVMQTVEQIIAKYGQIHIWVNNAGYGLFQTCMDMSLESFKQMMDVNYFGTVRCTKAVLPYMLNEDSGHIINIGSMAGKIGSAKGTGYSATKHAVLGFTNSLRQELFGTGVKVSTVNPGPIKTPFFDIADPSGEYVNNIEWFMLEPEQVAKTITQMMRKHRAEKDIPWIAGVGVKLYQLAPNLLDRIAFKLLNKK